MKCTATMLLMVSLAATGQTVVQKASITVHQVQTSTDGGVYVAWADVELDGKKFSPTLACLSKVSTCKRPLVNSQLHLDSLADDDPEAYAKGTEFSISGTGIGFGTTGIGSVLKSYRISGPNGWHAVYFLADYKPAPATTTAKSSAASLNPSKAATCEELVKGQVGQELHQHGLSKAVWDALEQMSKEQTGKPDKTHCVTMEIGIQTLPAKQLLYFGIKPEPDFWMVMNEKVWESVRASNSRTANEKAGKEKLEIDGKLRKNMLSVETEPLDNGNGTWSTVVRIQSKATIFDVQEIYVDLQVYDQNKNLVWDGTTRVERLKPGTTHTQRATYNPAHGDFIPNSVPRQIFITNEEFKIDKVDD